MNKSKLYAVGIGPGDKELITVKAAKILNNADTVFAPVSKNGSIALDIIKDYVNKKADIFKIDFPMIKDKNRIAEFHNKAAENIINELKKNKTVVFITLGDIGFYSTYSYIKDKIKSSGFETELIPGITSFSSGAAAAGINLCKDNEKVAVIPFLDSSMSLNYYIDNFDTIVLMKIFKTFENIKDILYNRNLIDNCILFSNIGMEDEKIYKGKEILNADNLSYFTTLIVKKGKV